jgi:RNA polymerase sigma-70 factor (ECF subfamily)
MMGADARGSDGDAGRTVTYCLIPEELAEELHDVLRAHFRDGDVEVIVERRADERRSAVERRRGDGSAPGNRDRRRIGNPAGRRAGERRASLATVEDARRLPPHAEGRADRINFADRLEPATEHAEDLDTARVVTRIQAGADSDFSIIYRRYFDRVYAYLRILLEDPEEAEALTRTTFERVHEETPSYERDRQPFRAWIFAAVRKEALRHLRDDQELDLADPLTEGTHLEQAAVEHEELFALHWITDRDLLLLIERLPPAERRVLLLRYMLELPSSDVAEVLKRDGPGVRQLEHRAGDHLRSELAALADGDPQGSGS